MSSALSYLLLTRIKNQIKSLLKSPGKLIYTLLLLAVIASTLLTGNKNFGGRGGVFRDIKELTAGVFVLFTVLFVLIANNGFSNGASMFRMPDVNLIFPSPIHPSKVLFFGLIQQLGTSLLLGFFLLFQYGWLHGLYGIPYSTIIVILLGFGLTTFCAHLTAMTIYTFTNSNEKRKRIVKAVFYGIILVTAAGLVATVAQDEKQLFTRLLDALNSGFVRLFPVSGWAAHMVHGFISGHFSMLAAGLAGCAVYIAAMTALIVSAKQDYYEDVLKTTEQSHSAITAKKSGQIGESIPKNVKVGRMGLNKGEGSSAFYYKHLLENRRASVFVLSGQRLIFAACIVMASFFMKGAGISAIFITATYIQLIAVALGRLTKELIKPYVYLVPEPPFQKLLACIRESFSGIVIEALLVFVPIAFIMQLTAAEVLCCILARISFALLFTAGNVMVCRVFGTVTSKILTFVFYFATMIVVCIPGIAAAVLLTTTQTILISENITILLALTVCNIPVALLVFFACRNMLQYAELNNR